MGEKEIKVKQYTCEKCGHIWLPKNPNKKPRVCPSSKCHSAWWDIPKNKKEGKEP